MKIKLTSLAIAALLLAGCSHSPTKEDVDAAYKRGFLRGVQRAETEMCRQIEGAYVTNKYIELPKMNAARLADLPKTLWAEEAK